MEFFQKALAFIVTLGVLVTIHEFGHFWVARRCGVKILRFSVGFGSPLLTWRDKQGTEFVIAALPLGGYVKMLDEREGDVSAEERHLTFNQQAVGKRIAIAAAGPVANFIFAVFAYWCMFVLGIQTLAPVVGSVSNNSPAQQAGIVAGAELTSVDGSPVYSWGDVNMQLVGRLGDTGAIEFGYRLPDESLPHDATVPINDWLIGKVEPNPVLELGMRSFVPDAPAVVHGVTQGGRAQQGGMEPGDRIVAVEGRPVGNWSDFVREIKASPEKQLTLSLERAGRSLDISVRPEAREHNGEAYGVIGAEAKATEWPPGMLRDVKYSPFVAVGKALEETWDMSLLTLTALKKIVTGRISVENLGGPLTIASAAGISAKSGLEAFLGFLAYLSISLGILNLLPIPVLDGGHLLYYFVELIRGKPLSEEKQQLGIKVGMALIAFVMLLAFYNDLSKL
ncbi:RIP metalloprotease RseP [Hahella sp. HN01]|uniref:RIP metalloprotease RseP n=1 Tax=Hahella sp. HN01 TaxID=2847262 RepID=UPI001C1ED636|nr:RIP metalloprotease RseP [Hahella sp. HN01]MBU6949928.1 RIP metalloprotease RseP [Hahella sp. HN01]